LNMAFSKTPANLLHGFPPIPPRLLRIWRLVGAAALAACLFSGSVQAKAKDYLEKPQEWYQSEEARRIAGDILSFQSAWGGWPKNTDTASQLYAKDPLDLHPTFDNSATTDELRFLARMLRATGDERYRAAFERGLDYVLIAQYPTGGWPQSYPPDDYYHRHITFNDDAMARVMEFVREVARAEDYSFLDKDRREAAAESFERGLDCILKCQIKVDGKLTVWCAQHDEETYEPRPARSFELASLSGSESVRITRLLMSLERPSPAVVQAVDAAVAWFRQTALPGVKVVKQINPNLDKNDKTLVEDPGAAPIWARFYEIGTNKPFFADRDGVPREHLEDISYERRNGYGWMGTWPTSLVNKQYAKWQASLTKKSVASPSAGVEPTPAKPRARLALAGDEGVTDHDGWAFGFKKRLRPTGTWCFDLSGTVKRPAVAAPESAISDLTAMHDVPPPSGAAPLPVKKRLEYLSDAWWQKALEKKPDCLLLQFGGNEVPARHEGQERESGLIHKIADAVTRAKAAGIKPVLVTALPRWSVDSEGKLETETSIAPEAVKKAAVDEHVPLIDLNARAIALVERIGPEGMRRLARAAVSEAIGQPSPTKPAEASPEASAPKASPAPPPKLRPTRLTPEGSEVFGGLVAEEFGKAVPEAKILFR
jgi:PelA/Pel-15E family pectate lyase